MISKALRRAALALGAVLALQAPAALAQHAYSINVLNQRTIALTAGYWNPIITYVSSKSGVQLELKLAKSAKEGNEIAERGGYDFIYTNHFFTPQRDKVGFKVLARAAGPGIRSQIVVPEESPIRTLQQLEGKEVAFVSPDAFAGYWLPMDALLKAKVHVTVLFTGNQEASSAQLKVNKIDAAAVNGTVLARYARRESFSYRALWTSELYQDLCLMAHPKVPAEKVAAVKAAFIGMSADPEGRKILEMAGELLKVTGEQGFVAAENRDYDNYRTFYRTTKVK